MWSEHTKAHRIIKNDETNEQGGDIEGMVAIHWSKISLWFSGSQQTISKDGQNRYNETTIQYNTMTI